MSRTLVDGDRYSDGYTRHVRMSAGGYAYLKDWPVHGDVIVVYTSRYRVLDRKFEIGGGMPTCHATTEYIGEIETPEPRVAAGPYR